MKLGCQTVSFRIPKNVRSKVEMLLIVSEEVRILILNKAVLMSYNSYCVAILLG